MSDTDILNRREDGLSENEEDGKVTFDDILSNRVKFGIY